MCGIRRRAIFKGGDVRDQEEGLSMEASSVMSSWWKTSCFSKEMVLGRSPQVQLAPCPLLPPRARCPAPRALLHGRPSGHEPDCHAVVMLPGSPAGTDNCAATRPQSSLRCGPFIKICRRGMFVAVRGCRKKTKKQKAKKRSPSLCTEVVNLLDRRRTARGSAASGWAWRGGPEGQVAKR